VPFCARPMREMAERDLVEMVEAIEVASLPYGLSNVIPFSSSGGVSWSGLPSLLSE
jgi:hypothetical protein